MLLRPSSLTHKKANALGLLLRKSRFFHSFSCGGCNITLRSLKSALTGGPLIPLCSGLCEAEWSRDGKVIYFFWNSFAGNARTYVLPIIPGSDLPKLPKSGFQSEKELRTVATQVLEGAVSPGPDSSRYTFSKETSHRNLYRIPLQ